MATQKVNYEGLETFILENKNRVNDIIELAQEIENCFNSIEIDSVWLGNNADAFYDATNKLFNSSAAVQNVSNDSLKILDYLEKALASVQQTDAKESKEIGES